VLTGTAVGVKDEIVLSSAASPMRWVFPLRVQGLTPELAGPQQAVLFRDGKGEVRAVIPPGDMIDSSRVPVRSVAVSYTLVRRGDGWALQVDLDRDWLTDARRVFPVKVDPTLRVTPNTKDTMVSTSSTFANRDNSYDPLLYVGTGYDGESASYLAFDMWGTLSNKFVRGASLNFFCTSPRCVIRNRWLCTPFDRTGAGALWRGLVRHTTQRIRSSRPTLPARAAF
jgi:hypothetical protein